MRDCIVRVNKDVECRAKFHMWFVEAQVLPPSMLRGGHNGGAVSTVMALVEYEDGTCARVYPESVRFIGGEQDANS